MPVPNTMADLSTLAGSNFPTGSEAIGNSLDNYIRAAYAILRSTNAISSSSINSASTTDIANSDGEHVFVLGTATINSFGTGFAGCKRELRFNDACTLVHSGSIILPDSLPIATATNQTYQFRCLTPGVWTLVGSGRDYASLRRTGGTMTGTVTMQNASILFTDTGAGTSGRQTIAGNILYVEAPVSGTVSVRGLGGLGGANLDVNGFVTAAGSVSSTGAGAIVLFSDRSGGNGWGWYSTGGNARLNRAGDGDKLTCDTAGNLTAVGNVTGGSDERVKANWRDLPGDLVEQLAGLERVGTYDRTDIAATQTGVGAQSLRRVLPHTVHEDESGFLSVAYGNAALVGVVALSQRLLALEAHIKGGG